jgi:hypothetical protein
MLFVPDAKVVFVSKVPDGFTFTFTKEPPPAEDSPTSTLRVTPATIKEDIGADSVTAWALIAFVRNLVL